MPTTINLTPKQLRIVQLIRDWRLANGYSPTMQEIADELGVSKVTVFEHVEALIRKGALRRDPHKARSLSVAEEAPALHEDMPSISFPLIGRIAAGYPIERFQQDDRITLDELFGPRRGQRGNTFALEVDGDSMRDEGILNGDFVIIEQRDTARDGERVVALLEDGETTLKTFFRQPDGTIRLQPANPQFKPIIVDDCRIQGVVVGVLRRYE